MPLVVDGSVALKWVLPESDSDRARLLIRRGDLAAPDQLRLEVANALWKLVRRGTISPKLARRAWNLFAGIPVTFQQAGVLADAALDVAIKHNIPVYDGTYVALASMLDCPLVTGDRRLLEAARAGGIGHRVLTLGDLP